MTAPFDRITRRLNDWAGANDHQLDARSWFVEVGNGLFQTMSEATLSDLSTSGELDAVDGGRISAPHSSSALACNIFDPWRDRDATPLMRALGLDPGLRVAGFEQVRPTGLGGTPPTLDVMLEGSLAKPVGVEVKLREPYGPVHNAFRESYFRTDGLWRGLECLRTVAEGIAAGVVRFERLHAAQLIKHSLGLARWYGSGGFTLMYLWHDEPSRECDTHRKELEWFARAVEPCVDLRSVTLREMTSALEVEDAWASSWRSYLVDRYLDEESGS